VSVRGAALALALACMLTGCAQTFDATTLGVPATLASAAGTPAVGDRFQVSTRAVFGFWGIVTLKQPSLQKALAAQVSGGAGIADVKIRTRSRFADILFTALTLGILVPRTVTFEGVVTK
jgi:hypothetical protein